MLSSLRPRAGVARGGHQSDLLAQGAYFGHPIQSYDLAKLTGRDMAQPFGAADPAQRHEAQHQEDVQGAIEAGRKMEVPAQSAEQAVGAQRRQPSQHAGHLHVLARLKSRGRTLRQTHRRCDPLIGARTGHAHAQGRLCVVAAAFGLGAARHLASLRHGALGRCGQHRYRLALERLAQRRFIDAYLPGHYGRANPLGQKTGALRAHLCAHDRRLGYRGVAKE